MEEIPVVVSRRETQQSGLHRAVLVLTIFEQDALREAAGRPEYADRLMPLVFSLDENRPTPALVVEALCDYWPEPTVRAFLHRASERYPPDEEE